MLDEDAETTTRIREQQFAMNDPAARTLLEKTKEMVRNTAPVDQSIVTFLILFLDIYGNTGE